MCGRSALLYVYVVDPKTDPNPLNKVTYTEERISGDNKDIHVYVSDEVS